MKAEIFSITKKGISNAKNCENLQIFESLVGMLHFYGNNAFIVRTLLDFGKIYMEMGQRMLLIFDRYFYLALKKDIIVRL